jgi:hypothetical protein
MITTLNGVDTIKTVSSGKYRAHRQAAFWIGDYATYADAQRALQIANSDGATDSQRGIYDGGVNADEQTHLAAVTDMFGAENRVTDDHVRRTILPGESYNIVAGFPVRA